MSRSSVLILLGILVVLAPFSGLPIAIWKFLEIVSGVAIFSIALSLRSHQVQRTETAGVE